MQVVKANSSIQGGLPQRYLKNKENAWNFILSKILFADLISFYFTELTVVCLDKM